METIGLEDIRAASLCGYSLEGEGEQGRFSRGHKQQKLSKTTCCYEEKQKKLQKLAILVDIIEQDPADSCFVEF